MLGLAGSDHGEAPPQTPAARSKAQAATPWAGQKVPHQRWDTVKRLHTQGEQDSRVAGLASRSAVGADTGTSSRGSTARLP